MIDFTFWLFALTLITGVVSAIDIFFLAPRRKMAGLTQGLPKIAEQCRSFFPVFLFVLLFRSFIASPFSVPSGSLEPTVKPGDLIYVNHFSYGLRFPVWDKKFFAIGEPKRGDIAVFKWPVNPSVDFVKRVIGLPGDHISYINKVLYINGKKMDQTLDTTEMDSEGVDQWRMNKFEEDINGIKHGIYVCADTQNCPNPANYNFYDLIIPSGEYFMMGDNRDNSDDSRAWGFVSEDNLVGKGEIIWMSWDSNADWLHKIRWSRIGIRL